MIEPFEAALADLLADRILTEDAVAAVTRPRDGLGAAPADEARVLVQVIDAALTADVGGDRDERLGSPGDLSTRPAVRAGGEVVISVEVGPATLPTDQQAQRRTVMEAADLVLAALHDPRVRSGTVFGDAHGQGFAIDGFRMRRLEHPGDPDPGFRRIDVVCEYQGRFWPVEELAAGDVIEAPIRTRLALLDPELPRGLRVTAGDPDLVIPIRLDLRARGGASDQLAARLAGAEPPGQLVGAEAAPGWTAMPAAGDGSYPVVYRPPAALAAAALARVRLALVAADEPTVPVGQFEIEVAA